MRNRNTDSPVLLQLNPPALMLAPAARACSAAPSRVLLLPGRAGAPAACAATAHLRRAGAHRRQTFTVQAAGGGGGGGAAQQWREEVTFTLPGQPIPLCCAHVTQRDMDSLFNKLGALGFEMEDGRLSQRLEDLPTEGAAVALVLPSHPPLATQVRPWFACCRRPAACQGGVGRLLQNCLLVDPLPTLVCPLLCWCATCSAQSTASPAAKRRSWGRSCAAAPAPRRREPRSPCCRQPPSRMLMTR